MPAVGFLGANSASISAPIVAVFEEGLAETGYLEGKNVRIEYRWAEGDYSRMPALAADLVQRKVDVIAATIAVATRAARQATSTIPIVFVASDAQADGLVPSLARPEGNLTGVSVLSVELASKRFELIAEMVPRTGVIAMLVNPNNPNTQRMAQDTEAAARTRGVRLQVVQAAAENDFETAFNSVAQLRAQALIVPPDPFFTVRHEPLVDLASRHAIPTIYAWREFTVAG